MNAEERAAQLVGGAAGPGKSGYLHEVAEIQRRLLRATHEALLHAARWAEKNPGVFANTAPELYALAAKAEAGLLDEADLPALAAVAVTFERVIRTGGGIVP